MLDRWTSNEGLGSVSCLTIDDLAGRYMSYPACRTVAMCDIDDVRAASGWDAIIVTREVQHLFEVAMDQCVEEYGLTYAQYRALEVILANHEMHVAELARRLRVTRQATQAVVEKLDRSGYVHLTRERHVTYVAPTAKARRELAELRRIADVPLHLESQLDPWQLGRLVELLTKASSVIQAPERPYWWLDRRPNYT